MREAVDECNDTRSMMVEQMEIPLCELHPFPNQPFKVANDEAMDSLVESIRANGLLNRIIVRPRKAGGYEIISGHRRVEAFRIAGFETISADLHRNMSDDAAVLALIECNLRQRVKILPSERAIAYKMMRDALSHRGVSLDGSGKETKDIIAETYGESPRQIARYIRLTHLEPRLLAYVDAGKLKVGNAMAISFLNSDVQAWIAEHYEQTQRFPTTAQIKELRTLADEGRLSRDDFDAILLDVQASKAAKSPQISFFDKLREKHFPGLTDEDIQQQIFNLVEAHFHRRRMGL